MLCCVVLCCVVLCCVVLCCVALCCVVLCCACCAVLCCGLAVLWAGERNAPRAFEAFGSVFRGDGGVVETEEKNVGGGIGVGVR